MPRPTRKPKRFNPSTSETNIVDAPVASTPLQAKQSTTNPPPPASPNLSPIQRETEFHIFNDESNIDQFGFSKVKGVKKPIVPIEIDSDDDNDEIEALDPVSVKREDDDEDIYGEQIVPTKKDVIQPSPLPPTPQKKIINKLRTSQLLPLLPTRRKRQVKKKSVVSLDASDDENGRIKVKSGKKKRVAVVDKENDVPKPNIAEVDSEEEKEMEERRNIVKQKFAEVDQWEMAFETVDLSFSSQ